MPGYERLTATDGRGFARCASATDYPRGGTVILEEIPGVIDQSKSLALD